MSESIHQDADRSPDMKRTTIFLDECIHNEGFIEFEIRELERLLAEHQPIAGSAKTRVLVKIREANGELIRAEYCIQQCPDYKRCNTGQRHMSAVARKIRFPIYRKNN